MLVDSIVLFGKEFHIFLAEGKNEFKYELIVHMFELIAGALQFYI